MKASVVDTTRSPPSISATTSPTPTATSTEAVLFVPVDASVAVAETRYVASASNE